MQGLLDGTLRHTEPDLTGRSIYMLVRWLVEAEVGGSRLHLSICRAEKTVLKPAVFVGYVSATNLFRDGRSIELANGM